MIPIMGRSRRVLKTAGGGNDAQATVPIRFDICINWHTCTNTNAYTNTNTNANIKKYINTNFQGLYSGEDTPSQLSGASTGIFCQNHQQGNSPREKFGQKAFRPPALKQTNDL